MRRLARSPVHSATPLQEEERLALLRECRILDTGPERAFDDIVALASRICNVPIALVSLVDESRQWFKARQGLEVSETPREYAFCAHAIQGSDPFEVPDAAKDPRFASNPLVLGDPAIRFYFGVPLQLAEGHALGTLCVIDRRPRKLSDEQELLVQNLANLVTEQIEARRRSFRLTAALERVQTLEALLPMCASCKKVRVEEGYWRQVEVYLQRHGTTITHGLCPTCEAETMRSL